MKTLIVALSTLLMLSVPSVQAAEMCSDSYMASWKEVNTVPDCNLRQLIGKAALYCGISAALIGGGITTAIQLGQTGGGGDVNVGVVIGSMTAVLGIVPGVICGDKIYQAHQCQVEQNSYRKNRKDRLEIRKMAQLYVEGEKAQQQDASAIAVQMGSELDLLHNYVESSLGHSVLVSDVVKALDAHNKSGSCQKDSSMDDIYQSVLADMSH